MKPHIKYGLLTGLICSVLYIAMTYLSNAPGLVRNLLDLGSYLGIAGMVYMALKERKEMQHGYLEYGEGVGTGTLTGLIGGLITGVAYYITMKFFNRDFMLAARDKIQETLEAKGGTDEQIEMTRKMSKLIVSPGGFGIMNCITVLIIALLAALILSAILKNPRPPIVREEDGPGMAA